MAKILQAVNMYGPHIKLGKTVQFHELAEWIAMRTGLNKSEVVMMLYELNEAIMYHNRRGLPVKLDGIGTFSPSMNRHGQININLRLDQKLRKRINNHDAYTGDVVNPGRIGLDNAAYKVLWDAEHPDDPLDV